MTTEEIIDYEVEKREVRSEQTTCDSCGRVIEDDEPATPVIINPSIEMPNVSTLNEIRRRRNESADDLNKLHAGRTSANKQLRTMYELSELDNQMKMLLTKTHIEAITLFDDACADCITSLADTSLSADDIQDVSDVTLTESQITERHRNARLAEVKAEETLKAANRQRSVVLSMAVVASIAGAAIAIAGYEILSSGLFVAAVTLMTAFFWQYYTPLRELRNAAIFDGGDDE